VERGCDEVFWGEGGGGVTQLPRILVCSRSAVGNWGPLPSCPPGWPSPSNMQPSSEISSSTLQESWAGTDEPDDDLVYIMRTLFLLPIRLS
jgi:hypothetical protein